MLLLHKRVTTFKSKALVVVSSHQTDLMTRILAILTLDMERIPSNFSDIIAHEREVVAKWKSEGFLENLFLRQGNGAVLIFTGIEEAEARSLMETLPLFPLSKSIDYLVLTKQF